MGFDTQASDWKVVGVGKLSGGLGLSGGVWLYIFKSNQAKYKGLFGFSGFGLGLGLPKLGISISVPAGDGTPINCARIFSLSELNGKFGLIASISVNVGGPGYSMTQISGFTIGKNYFVNQKVEGATVGGQDALPSLSANTGTWWHLGDTKKYGLN